MKITSIKKKLEVKVVLQYGIDFQDEDIESNPFAPVLKELKADSLTRIAKKNQFDGWSWTGHIENGFSKAIFYKELLERKGE